MNPTSIILRENNFLDNEGIITIASKCAGGKTLLCKSMLYHFLESEINVILFSEGIIKNFNTQAKKMPKNKAIVIFVERFGTYENTIDRFDKVINNNVPFLNGKTVIILDSPLFLTHNSESMVYDKFKCENTRRVLFEKINSNKTIPHKKLGLYEATKKNTEFLQQLSRNFNMPIVITTQLNRVNSDTNSIENVSTNIAYNSNLIITSERNIDENSFNLKIIKSRYSNENQHIECVYDKNSDSFVTK